jgi:acyl-CoA synthetase (AMP-forming)/AMP-acid ligase II
MHLFYKVSHQKFIHLRSMVIHPLLLAYGLTETSAAAYITPHDMPLSKAGSVGIILPNLEARLIGNDGVDVKPGEPGELWIRGPTIMKVNACG